jgi:hypothetical protein
LTYQTFFESQLNNNKNNCQTNLYNSSEFVPQYKSIYSDNENLNERLTNNSKPLKNIWSNANDTINSSTISMNTNSSQSWSSLPMNYQQNFTETNLNKSDDGKNKILNSNVLFNSNVNSANNFANLDLATISLPNTDELNEYSETSSSTEKSIWSFNTKNEKK